MVDLDGLVTGVCMQTFGEPAVYQAQGRRAQSITGVFDEAYVEVTPLGDLAHEIGIPNGINTASPVIGVQLSQFGWPPEQGGWITMPAGPNRVTPIVYLVRDVEPDGHGWALLKLTLSP